MSLAAVLMATYVAATPANAAAPNAPLAAILAAQFEADMRASPETATAYGDNRFNGQLDHRSLAAAARQDAEDEVFLGRLRAVADAGLTDTDRLSRDLLIEVLRQRIADYRLKTFEMPLTQMNGVHTEIADLPNAVPLNTLADYEAYLSRLRQVPQAFDETIAVLRQGLRDGLTPPRILLEKIPAQCQGTIAENPFLAPTRQYPASIPAADQARLTAAINQTVDAEVLPAYRRFAAFVADDYAPKSRAAIGLSSLPDGAARYQNAIREETTTGLTAAEVHALGLSEVARILGLMTGLAHRAGYADVAAYRAALKADPRYIPTSSDQIVQDFRRYIAAVQPRLPQMFGRLPQAPVTVEAVPPSQPDNASHYMAGTPDGARPGRIVVATSDYAHRSLLNDETIAYHEGVPGHHLQVSIQQQLTDLPAFRRHLIFDAYAEGWGVYAETLGKEMGLFQNPDSDFVRLQTELLRAVRLVIDTGIHADGWSRDRAVAYFRQSGAADEPMIQAETDRYIAWPAQGLSYKIGQLKFLELRKRAEDRLGPRFDIRAFHDLVLGGGDMPLDLLEARVDRWIGRGGPHA
jgi:uncharacterized protein (DUF885 family)